MNVGCLPHRFTCGPWIWAISTVSASFQLQRGCSQWKPKGNAHWRRWARHWPVGLALQSVEARQKLRPRGGGNEGHWWFEAISHPSKHAWHLLPPLSPKVTKRLLPKDSFLQSPITLITLGISISGEQRHLLVGRASCSRGWRQPVVWGLVIRPAGFFELWSNLSKILFKTHAPKSGFSP